MLNLFVPFGRNIFHLFPFAVAQRVSCCLPACVPLLTCAIPADLSGRLVQVCCLFLWIQTQHAETASSFDATNLSESQRVCVLSFGPEWDIAITIIWIAMKLLQQIFMTPWGQMWIPSPCGWQSWNTWQLLWIYVLLLCLPEDQCLLNVLSIYPVTV